MTYKCDQCKYTTESVNRTFTHEKRNLGHHMGIDFPKFFKDPKVQATMERLTKEDETEQAELLRKYKEDKIIYKHYLHQALKGNTMNGAGMRELLCEFVEEVTGTY